MKPLSNLTPTGRSQVAPRAGAWIETMKWMTSRASRLSPPARGRGLKLQQFAEDLLPLPSPPARGRGLKRS